MSRFVIDASTGAKWFLSEVHSGAARRLLSAKHDLLVPDLFFPEIASILWKRVRRGEISEPDAGAILQTVGEMPLQLHSAWPLVALALPLACRTDRTVYDCLYLALALREEAPMVTADEKFYNALKDGPLAPSLLWVDDVP